MRRAVPALLAAVVGLSSCGPTETRSRPTETGRYLVFWTPVPAPIPFNALFDLEVEWMLSDGLPPDPASTIQLDVRMPAHGHGMQTAPTVEVTAPGRATVRGLKFHMQGLWELRFIVQDIGAQDLAIFNEDFL